jgi:hypothetical protein
LSVVSVVIIFFYCQSKFDHTSLDMCLVDCHMSSCLLHQALPMLFVSPVARALLIAVSSLVLNRLSFPLVLFCSTWETFVLLLLFPRIVFCIYTHVVRILLFPFVSVALLFITFC